MSYAISMENYILETMLDNVNRNGRPALWFRPLAAVAAWLGFHGIGQINCLSCATAVADTFKHGILHSADPDLRGGSPDEFATFDNAPGWLFDSAGELAGRLMQSNDINAILTMARPSWGWRSSPISRGACNIIKTGDTIHLVDVHEQVYVTVDQTRGLNFLYKTLLRFIGPVSSAGGALGLWDIGFYQPRS